MKIDSQYLADLYNGNYVTEMNPNLNKYKNVETIMLFVDLPSKLKKSGQDNFQLKIEYVPGHAMDFGNLEVD